MQEELLKLENDFARAVTNNDVAALDGLLADDWIIVDPDGDISVSMIALSMNALPVNRWRRSVKSSRM